MRSTCIRGYVSINYHKPYVYTLSETENQNVYVKVHPYLYIHTVHLYEEPNYYLNIELFW